MLPSSTQDYLDLRDCSVCEVESCSSNLVAQAASMSSPVITEALECTHEVGVLVSRSGKCRSVLSTIAAELTDNFSTIRPLCPTRWLSRRPALQRIHDQYEVVLQGLEAMSQAVRRQNQQQRPVGCWLISKRASFYWGSSLHCLSSVFSKN